LQTEYGLSGIDAGNRKNISSSGIMIDNIALRGSAGLEFKSAHLDSILHANPLTPSLLILQFGLNVVPAKADHFGYYSDLLIDQVNHLMNKLPGVPILIVGVSDMGHMVEGAPQAYESVAKVTEAQKSAARECGSAFYDLLSFMGGPGSFRKWINYDPALMRRDFTHFTFKGGELVAEGIAGALINEVNKFRESR
jgi:hypothetical protein